MTESPITSSPILVQYFPCDLCDHSHMIMNCQDGSTHPFTFECTTFNFLTAGETLNNLITQLQSITPRLRAILLSSVSRPLNP